MRPFRTTSSSAVAIAQYAEKEQQLIFTHTSRRLLTLPFREEQIAGLAHPPIKTPNAILLPRKAVEEMHRQFYCSLFLRDFFAFSLFVTDCVDSALATATVALWRLFLRCAFVSRAWTFPIGEMSGTN